MWSSLGSRIVASGEGHPLTRSGFGNHLYILGIFPRAVPRALKLNLLQRWGVGSVQTVDSGAGRKSASCLQSPQQKIFISLNVINNSTCNF